MADFEIKSGIGIIPEGTLEIKKDAFRGCVNLKSVIIPEGVKEISRIPASQHGLIVEQELAKK